MRVVLREQSETSRLPTQDTRFYYGPLNEVVCSDHGRIDHREREGDLTEYLPVIGRVGVDARHEHDEGGC